MTETQAYFAIVNYKNRMFLNTHNMFKWVIRREIRKISKIIIDFQYSSRILEEAIPMYNHLYVEYVRKAKGKSPRTNEQVNKIIRYFNNEQNHDISKFKKPFYFMENTPEMNRVKSWIFDICDALNGEYVETVERPMYFIKSNVQHPDEIKTLIMVNTSKYHYLNELGLINRGYCPVTGENLNKSNTVQFSLFGRTLNLSRIGASTSQEIKQAFNRNETTNIIFTYDRNEMD